MTLFLCECLCFCVVYSAFHCFRVFIDCAGINLAHIVTHGSAAARPFHRTPGISGATAVPHHQQPITIGKLAQKKTFSLSQNNRPLQQKSRILHTFMSLIIINLIFVFIFRLHMAGHVTALSTAFECHSTAGTCMTAAAREKAASFRRQLRARILHYRMLRETVQIRMENWIIFVRYLSTGRVATCDIRFY